MRDGLISSRFGAYRNSAALSSVTGSILIVSATAIEIERCQSCAVLFAFE